MIRGTTPTFTFTLKNHNINLNQARTVIATFKQSGKRIDVPRDRLYISESGYVVSVWLTQRESLQLTAGIPASVQINWTYANPSGGAPRRAATKPKWFDVDEQYYERVIE